MSFFTSQSFASVCVEGNDWREVAKEALEKLEGVRTREDSFNFGFMYVSDRLADDVSSILNLFKSVLKVDHWVGSVGMGVIGCNASVVDRPALSVMVGHFPEGSFQIFPENDGEHSLALDDPSSALSQWLIEEQPILSIVHADPLSEDDPQTSIKEIEQMTHSFVIGGITSSRSKHYQIADTVYDATVCGAFFTADVNVSTMLSQGCKVNSRTHTITKADETTILMLDDQRALDVLHEDFKEQLFALGEQKALSASAQSVETELPEDLLVGLMISNSDQEEYIARNILSVDLDDGSLTIAEHIGVGDHLVFLECNQKNMVSDLTQKLIQLRRRVEQERGSFNPVGGVYISCISRGFQEPETDDSHDIQIIRSILGDFPMTGYYAGGEISNAHLHGYSGVLALFF